MCHHCGAKIAKSSNCIGQENGHSTELISGPLIQSCKLCGTKIYKDTANQENSSSWAMPPIESSASNCSDISVDANICERRYLEDSGTDSSQEYSCSSSKGSMDDSNLTITLNGFHLADHMVKHETKQVSFDDSLRPSENIGTTESAEVQAGTDNNVEISSCNVDEASEVSSLNDEIDAEFWLPPEPEDQEDDVLGSISNYDDDDEGDYGAAWAEPSSLSSFGEEGSGSYKFKEEKLKAMNDVQNGKFRALVSQLVKSVGVYSSRNCGEDWVDIVTSISNK
ncbi:hypothetical protein C2S52_023305 [Perilla frutescens var. hirtella]|nr:hypothetical protein C2S52_023305 [Perilla frutescens var. hirtella]